MRYGLCSCGELNAAKSEIDHFKQMYYDNYYGWGNCISTNDRLRRERDECLQKPPGSGGSLRKKKHRTKHRKIKTNPKKRY